MIKTEIFNHYSKILDRIIEGSNFFKNYFQYPFYIDEDLNWEDMEDYPYFYETNVSMHNGCTRGCLIDENYDWVVKFDLPEAEKHGTCGMELDTYQSALVFGLDKYFTEPIYLGIYTKKINFFPHQEVYCNIEYTDLFEEENFTESLEIAEDLGKITRKTVSIELPLYAYPRAVRHDFFNCDEKEDSIRSFVSNSHSPLVERDERIGYAFVEWYGEEEFQRLSDFLEKHNVNDLHTGNIMELNGCLVLSDYAGYCED